MPTAIAEVQLPGRAPADMPHALHDDEPRRGKQVCTCLEVHGPH